MSCTFRGFSGRIRAETKGADRIRQEDIGAFIREIRKEKGLTQEQLAEKLGVSQRSVSRWETGKTMPDYAILPGICEALDVNVAELLGAERIEGDAVPKNQVTAMAHSMISLMNDRRLVRRLLAAVLSAVVTLACALGLYGLEFNVSAESTADLEQAINEYHFADEISADILERQAFGSRLYVLYGEKEYPGACGLACLQKGIFGKYRILSCDDSDTRWVHIRRVSIGRKDYCAAYCVNELPIEAYGICGVREEPGKNLTVEDAALLFRQDYPGAPFLRFTELPDDAVISPFRVLYYRNGAELPEDALESMLGPHFVEGAPGAGYGSAELGMIYVLEGIVLVFGAVLVRYFLSDAVELSRGKRAG